MSDYEPTPGAVEVRAVQWAPSGNALEGKVSQILRLLADGDRSFGYGYGTGWSVVFGHLGGDITVLPTQWVLRYPDGRIEVRNADWSLPIEETNDE